MEKNNKGLMILVAILSVIILGLVGYIAYDKISESDRNVEEENNNSNVNKKNVQVLSSEVGLFVVDKKGDVYYIPDSYGKWKGMEFQLNFDEVAKEELGVYGNYTVEGYDSNVYNDIDNDGFNGYKLNFDKIANAYEVIFIDQYKNTSIMFIGENGKISELCFINAGPETNTIVKTRKEIEGYENIVYLVEHYTNNINNVLLFDKYGNQYLYHGNGYN